MTTPTDDLAQALRESIVNEAWIARIRADYPDDTAGMDDETVIETYADGWKYADTWDHLGDARHDYERLADAYLELFEAHESCAQPHDLIKTGDSDAAAAICDANGDVVLAYCRRCKQGEGDLEETCQGPRAQPASVPDDWRKTFDELLEDYAGARAEVAAWNVTQSVHPPGGIRLPRSRLAKLRAHVDQIAAAPQPAKESE